MRLVGLAVAGRLPLIPIRGLAQTIVTHGLAALGLAVLPPWHLAGVAQHLGSSLLTLGALGSRRIH